MPSPPRFAAIDEQLQEVTPFAIEHQQRTVGDHTFGMKVGQKRKPQLSRLNTSATDRDSHPAPVALIEGDDDTLALQLARDRFWSGFTRNAKSGAAVPAAEILVIVLPSLRLR